MQIISGELKGAKLEKAITPKEGKPKVRPTTSYAKQVLFNLLNNNKIVATELTGKTVLDGYCGTGAVGIEFFSRGVAHVTFVDSDLENIKKIKQQAAKLGISCIAKGAFFPRPELKSKFDIIFLDPPYDEGKGGIAQAVKTLLSENANDGCLLILETLNQRKSLSELKEYLEKKGVLEKMVLEHAAGSKTSFLFFKNT